MKCEELWEVFKNNDFTYFTGVPDSTFKSWMSFLNDMDGKGLTNRIAAIERDAIGLASGYHVATNKIGVVYMQNSGLGNTINPITSLADKSVYNIPMLLMVGWRGGPGLENDAPQHTKMGQITPGLLAMLDIKFSILPKDLEKAKQVIEAAKIHMQNTNELYALVITKGAIEGYEKQNKTSQNLEMKREDAIKIIVDIIEENSVILGTTGKTSRELFEHRVTKNPGPYENDSARDLRHQKDFLMVGSMGAASAFAAETALQTPHRSVYIFDGDGAAIMSAGVLSTIGHYAPKNLTHVIFDNASYESTGGQPTTSGSVDFEKLALANGYKHALTVETREQLIQAANQLKNQEGPQMLIVKVEKGARKDLGRPTLSPVENKRLFMDYLE